MCWCFRAVFGFAQRTRPGPQSAVSSLTAGCSELKHVAVLLLASAWSSLHHGRQQGWDNIHGWDSGFHNRGLFIFNLKYNTMLSLQYVSYYKTRAILEITTNPSPLAMVKDTRFDVIYAVFTILEVTSALLLLCIIKTRGQNTKLLNFLISFLIRLTFQLCIVFGLWSDSRSPDSSSVSSPPSGQRSPPLVPSAAASMTSLPPITTTGVSSPISSIDSPFSVISSSLGSPCLPGTPSVGYGPISSPQVIMHVCACVVLAGMAAPLEERYEL